MATGFKRFLGELAERQDLVLAVFIVSVIFMLIIPLPTGLVDVLISFNLAIAVILLMVSVYLKRPLDFSAFPAVLLITTLFRLALSISTTRLILLQADAGQIVEAFGNFVVGGNLVVGLVVFLILTIVQFIVITKGSERVAEVSARFSLDALPGKQMSIDADMRAGALTLDAAREMRSKLQQESKLYGSMDGAMKFVKGDAIASLIIVFVNMLGGLAIGMLQRDLDFDEAITTYSVLTIGDGLIAQIPALFISITAGIIVTRVVDEDKEANLGRDIGQQVTAQPRALMVAAVMLLVFAFIPGFPSIIMLSLSAVIGIPALMFSIAVRRRALTGDVIEEDTQVTSAPLDANAVSEEQSGFAVTRDSIFAPTVPLMVDVPLRLATPEMLAKTNKTINHVRLTLYYRLGLPLSVIKIRRNENLPEDHYRIFVNEIPAADGFIPPDKLMVFDLVDNLNLYNIRWTEGEKFFPGRRSLWVDNTQQSALEAAEITFKSNLEVIQAHCETVFANHADLLIGIQETKYLLARMESQYPDLVKEVTRILPIQTISEILRRMVQERVSIRDLRQVLGTMVEAGGKEKDIVLLVEHIRISLARQICYQYAAGNNMLQVFLLDAKIEDTIRNSIRQTSSSSYLALDPNTSNKIVEAVKKSVESHLDSDANLVLLSSMDVRRYLRRLLDAQLPSLPVISHQEVTPSISLQPLGRIEL